MNGDAEKFDVKMIVLKYVHHGPTSSRFEFIADERDQTLADLVVPSLRDDFELIVSQDKESSENKRFVLESKDGQLHLFKILKSLKLYNWKLLTSNAFTLPGTSNSVETVFYYEKSLASPPSQQPTTAPTAVASVASKYAYNLKRTVPPAQNNDTHSSVESSSGKTGIEEEKSATSSYTQPKPLPGVPLRHFVPTPSTTTSTSNATNNYLNNINNNNTHANSLSTHSDETNTGSAGHTDTDYSLKRVSTNREKLLQKYNQHRRLSLGKAAAESEAQTQSAQAQSQGQAPPSPTRAGVVNKPVFGSVVSSGGVSGSATSTAPVTQAASANSAHHSSSSANTTFASTPPPTPLTGTTTSAATFSPTHHSTAANSTTNNTANHTNTTTQPATSHTTSGSTASTTEVRPTNAASAYPSLVRRVSNTKGFVQVNGAITSSAASNTSTTNNNTNSASGGDLTPKSMSRVPSGTGLDSHSSSFTHNNGNTATNTTTNPTVTTTAHSATSNDDAAAVNKQPSFALSKHSAPAPPSAPLPASIASAAAAAHTSSASGVSSANSASSVNNNVNSSANSGTSSSTAPTTAPAHVSESAPTLSVVQPSATVSSSSSSNAKATAEGEEDAQDEPVLRISSHNPLTAPSRAVQTSITPPTPEADQHEVSRTNHYSKLGSAFFSGNALGPGARRSGGRGGGYLSSLNK